MKITTWNVNGYRAIRGKNLAQVVSDIAPDVLCLQEVKARLEALKEEERSLDGYSANWNPAERPGYSGVASFSRSAPAEVRLGIGREEFDREGRVIATRQDGFWLYNIYFPNGQRDQERLDYKLAFYEALLPVCDAHHARGEMVVLTGDFNTSHREIDLARPKENSKVSGFLPEERVWIDRYLEHGFVDAYRVLHPDKVQYTWWAYFTNSRARNVGWRLDYYLVSAPMMARVQDVVIHDDIIGSDHCPVTMTLA